MTITVSTKQLPAEERLAYFREFALQLPESVDIRAGEQDVEVSISLTMLGGAVVTAVTTDRVEFEIHRPRRLIQRSDPECYRLLFNVNGRTGVEQAGVDTELRDGQMALYDSSLPLRGWRRTASEGARLIIIEVPHGMLPLPPAQARRILAVPLPDNPAARLVAAAVRQVSHDAAGYEPDEAVRISTALVDLLAIAMCSASSWGDTRPAVPPGVADAQHRTLVIRVQAFIERNLGDRDLSPGMIAAAHHVSVRTLHRAFHDEGIGLAAYIRRRRLERCRRDLVDPMCARLPLRAIAARWAFADHAHLTRTFQAAYRIPPTQYRDQHRRHADGAEPS